MTATKQQKPIIYVARYALKRDKKLPGVVVYRIKASTWTPDNQDVYCTTVINGTASSCTCPHREKLHT